MQLKSVVFRRERQATWKRLEHLLQQARGRSGLSRLTPRELAELPLLYRAALSSLSVARAISVDRDLVAYLESLAQRAHVALHAPRVRMLPGFIAFFTTDFPRAARLLRWELLVSFALLAAGTVAGCTATLEDPDRYYAFVSRKVAQGRGPHSTAEELRSVLFAEEGEDRTTGGVVTSAFLFQNNANVAILAFALGILGGAPTAFLLAITGMMLGAFFAIHHRVGLGWELGGWLSIHGVTEIGAIVIAAAAGLALGRGVLFPGALTRADALVERGRVASRVALGAVLMLFVAGILEGIFRQAVNDTGARYAIACVSAAVWGAWILLCGRGKR